MRLIDENQLVEIPWTTINKKYYSSLGYIFTNYGDKFLIKYKDMKYAVTNKIKVTCDICKKEYLTPFKSYIQRKNKSIDACHNCANQKRANTQRIERADKYFSIVQSFCENKGYKLLSTKDEFYDLTSRVKYICPLHGEQNQSYNAIISYGSGCRQCGRKIAGLHSRIQMEEVKDRIESVNGNKWLNYGKYTGAMDKNLEIQCSCGSIFITSLRDYKIINRCHSCALKVSLYEKYITDFLLNNNIEFVTEYRFNDCRDKYPLPFDFYLLKHHACIEFDGEQHFKDSFFINKYGKEKGVELFNITQKHDKIKNEYCIKHNIPLLRISYKDVNNIDQVLSSFIDELSEKTA